jgi:hypothetical protein
MNPLRKLYEYQKVLFSISGNRFSSKFWKTLAEKKKTLMATHTPNG